MRTITPRKRKDGSIGYRVQIRLKEQGQIVYTQARAFDREAAARAWSDKRERELAGPGALESAKVEDPPLANVIDRYIGESKRPFGKTKKQVPNAIKVASIGSLKCSETGSAQIVQIAQNLEVQPQTAGNYVSRLAAVVSTARPAWSYPLEQQAMDDARKVLKKLGATSKSNERFRRPTHDELDRIHHDPAVGRHGLGRYGNSALRERKA